ncbi:hypothetical protein ABZT49_07715 [Methylobacterium sp. EM32]|uniref:hypothetical protein n=1 Tax=Methylobacterium sp. EM32 TaxID=3163481 RepID=UPI0033A1C80A
MAEVEFEVPANKNVRISLTRHKDEACKLEFWYLPANQVTWLFIVDIYADKNITHTLDNHSYPALRGKATTWQMKCVSILEIGGQFQESYPTLRPEELKATVLICGQPTDPVSDPNTSVVFDYV